MEPSNEIEVSPAALEWVSVTPEAVVMARILDELGALNNKFDQVLFIAQDVKEQAGPIIASVEKSPILRMLGGK